MKYQPYKSTFKKETKKLKLACDGMYQQLKCAVQNWREHSRIWSEKKKSRIIICIIVDVKLLSAQSKTQ